MRLDIMKVINTFETSEINWFAAIGIDLTKTITWTFDDDVPPLTFDATKAHLNIQRYAMMDRFVNRIKDTAAIKRDKSNNLTITETMRRAKMVTVVDHYESGVDSWNLKASAAPIQHPVFLALAEQEGIPYEEAVTMAANEMLNKIAAS